MSDLDLELNTADFSTLLDTDEGSLVDRLSILQIISLYSHLVDDFDPRHWGELFTDDARFEIRFPSGSPESTSAFEGRQAILDVILPRQEAFREARVQRRHYLTNPAVINLMAESARVMAYLMLASVDPEAGMEVEATGRYDGIVVRTPSGWRIRRWRLSVDGAGAQWKSNPDEG